MNSRFLAALLLTAVCLLSGCISTAPDADATGESVHISVLPTGMILFDDQAIPRDRLVKALRKSGATAATTLYINIPKTMPLAEVSSLTQTLASAGYRRVFYKRPKVTQSSVIKP